MQEKLSLIWTFFLTRFRVVSLVLLFICLYGSFAFVTISRETEPTVDIPAGTIITMWPGASPADVEEMITRKLEQKIKTLSDLDKYTSSSLSGVSMISVQFDVDVDKDNALQKLREKIDDAAKDLPGTISDDPSVTEVSITDVPVIKLIVSGEYAWSELKSFAENLEEELETIEKVKSVETIGAPTDQFHVIIDPIKLQGHSLGVSEIFNALKAAHNDMPLGKVSIDGLKVEVTMKAKLKTALDIADSPISVTDKGEVIRVGDVSTVRREFDNFEVETYYGLESTNKPAIMVNVIKSGSNGNVLKMVENVFQKIDELKSREILPKNLTIGIGYNRADEITESLDTLTTSGLQTILLIGLVIFIAVGWRESILAATAIPLSMAMTVIILKFLGQTFNGVSLFSLVLGIGLLVDNAIVIVEGMNDFINEKKLKPLNAAIETLKVFRWPLIAGTMTTVFAFLPMLFFISGVMGDYIAVIPITVMTILFSALFVSLWLLPSVSRQFFLRVPSRTKHENRILKKVQNFYSKFMQKILAKKTNIIFVLTSSMIVFGFSIWLVVSQRVPVEIFPSSDFTFFNANFEFPEGTELSETRKLMKPLATEIQKFMKPQSDGDIWVKDFIFTVGAKQTFSRENSSSSNKSNYLGLTINLTDKDKRKIKSYEIMPIMQKEMEKVVPAHVVAEFTEIKGGPPTSAPLEIRITGEDLNHLIEISEELKTEIAKIPETINVHTSAADKTLEMSWTFDRTTLAKYGLSPQTVMQTLRTGVNGMTAIKIAEGDDDIDVEIRMDWLGSGEWSEVESLDFLRQIFIKTPKGEFITLDQVATAKLSSEVAEVSHRDGEKIIKVLSDLQQGTPVSILEPQIKKIIAKISLKSGEAISMGGDSEEGNRLMGEMSNAMIFAVLLIFIVLLIQFNSFGQSFTTLCLIPLSLTGVFIGFWLINLPISFPTMIGIVSLAGIIVNDAIVLIDQINRNLANNLPWAEANIEAGIQRLQPIFLTSITTVVGMLPLSLSDEMWAGLGFAIVFGMLLSTVLTLILTPCLLSTWRGMINWFLK